MSNNSQRNYYEILGIPQDADAQAIRKAYLRASLKYHPDKNPDNVEEAKIRFVEIGQAYETLKEPRLRAVYDRELRAGVRGGGRSSSTRNSRPSSSRPPPPPTEPKREQYYSSSQKPPPPSSNYRSKNEYNEYDNVGSQPSAKEYDNYRDAFDDFVAGMSETELRTAMGVAAVVGSVMGSVMGASMMGGNKKGASGGILSSMGSVVGSMMASEAASNAVRAVHQESRDRIAYNQAVKDAVARGVPPPQRPQSNWGNLLDKAMELGSISFGAAGAAASASRPETNQSYNSETNRSYNPETNRSYNEPQQDSNTSGFAATWRDKITKSVNEAKANAAAAVAAKMAEQVQRDMGFAPKESSQQNYDRPNNNQQNSYYEQSSNNQRYDTRGAPPPPNDTYGQSQPNNTNNNRPMSQFDMWREKVSKAVDDVKDQAFDAVAKAAVANMKAGFDPTRAAGASNGTTNNRY